MSLSDHPGRSRLRVPHGAVSAAHAVLPKGLYARSLLIVIVPMVMLQSAIAYFFMERHWQLVTFRLSTAVVQDIAALDRISTARDPARTGPARREDRARNGSGSTSQFLPQEPLPPALPKPFFSMLDAALSGEIPRRSGGRSGSTPSGRSSLVEIRIQLDDSRDAHRRQPQRGLCVELAHFHRLDGRHVVRAARGSPFRSCATRSVRSCSSPKRRRISARGAMREFRPHGAREVRQAGYAFIEMKRRMERAMEQRTAMLNGVSHDLRTMLTRFKLSLALLGEGPEIEAMQEDIDEMRRMLEAYLAFARGDARRGGGANGHARAAGRTRRRDCEAAWPCRRDRGLRRSDCDRAARRLQALLVNLVAMRCAMANASKSAPPAIRPLPNGDVDDDGPGIPPKSARMCSARSISSMRRATRMRAAPDLAWPSPATSPAPMAAICQLTQSPLGGSGRTVRVPA